LNVVVEESVAILKFFSSEEESLLIKRDSFLILDILLDVINSVRSLNIESDSLSSKDLSSKDLDEDYHKIFFLKVKVRFPLDVVVWESDGVLKYHSSKDKSLLNSRDTFLVLNPGFDNMDSLTHFNTDG